MSGGHRLLLELRLHVHGVVRQVARVLLGRLRRLGVPLRVRPALRALEGASASARTRWSSPRGVPCAEQRVRSQIAFFCSEGAKRYCDFDMRVLSWLLVVCTPTNVRTRHIRKHQHKSYLEIITFEFPETNPRNSTPRFSAILWNPRSQPLVSTFKS